MRKHFNLWARAIFLLCFCFALNACVNKSSNNDTPQRQAAKARVELALGYLNQQQFTEAKRNLDKAQTYAPDYYLVHSALAYFYQQQGLIEQATQAYQTAIKLDQNQGNTFNNYGTFLCSQGKFELAYQQFDKALQSKNYYYQADTYENIVLCAISNKDQNRQQQTLLLLQKLDPTRVAKLQQIIQKQH